jgi:4'-phosphopantetheinyl transferase
MMALYWALNDVPWPPDYGVAQLPESMAASVNRFHRWQDRQASLLGRLLLRHALAQAGVPLTLNDVFIGERGRPMLPAPYDFNISHTDGCVVCAFTEGSRVGVDIEAMRPLQLDDYREVLSLTEQTRVSEAVNPAETLLEVWTMKEAVAKAAGHGIALGALPDVAGVGPVPFAGRPWEVKSFRHGQWVGAVASDGESLDVEQRHLVPRFDRYPAVLFHARP